MGVKREVEKRWADLKDAVDEAKHRSLAEVERSRRTAAGDEMTASQKVGSKGKELGHRAKAEIDKAKRKVRDKS